MFDSEMSLCGTWKLYLAENRAVKDAAPRIRTGEDAERLIGKAGGFSVSAEVPGNFERDLERAGRIPDPFFGTNVLKLQELENLHLWYVRSFEFHGAADALTFLRFEGIDTVAEIIVNGVPVRSVSNMFLTCEIPVGGILRDGENEIVVHILPAVIAAREYEIPVSSNAQKYNYESLYLRKAASMFGWDIMPRIVSGGIWKPVSLVRKKPDRIEDLFLYTNELKMKEDGLHAEYAALTAYFTLHIEEDFLRDFRLRVSGTCGDSAFTMECEPLHTNGRMAVRIREPKLWWCRNTGAPDLYDCRAELLFRGEVVDTYRLRTGIRTVSLSRTSVTDKEGNGDFCFVINGRRVFAMGTNWVPLDAFHSNDINRVDAAMALAEDVGCNIIRLWGGNVYESQRFFDLCDEKGIMVWQDFSMGCAVYPQERRFLEMLEPEIVAVVKAYRNHPSLVLWAGDNECDCAVNWAGWKRDPNENIITRELLPRLLRAHDFTRPFLPSSPFTDAEAYRTCKPIPEDHLWGPRDYFKGNYYKSSVCHFASETGYHGCPSPASLKTFLAPGALYPIFDGRGVPNADWLAHASCMRTDMSDPYAYRIGLMRDQVRTLFGCVPDTLEDFARMSQISQAEAKKYFIERFRVSRGRRNGIIWWNLIDGWPQVSDAVVDYGYTKKLAYHYIKRAQQPVLFAFDEPDGGTFTLYGVNEYPEAVTASCRVTDTADGSILAERSLTLNGEASTPVVSLNAEDRQHVFLFIEWEYERGGTAVFGKSHYIADVRGTAYADYLKALRSCGFDEWEGFPEEI